MLRPALLPCVFLALFGCDDTRPPRTIELPATPEEDQEPLREPAPEYESVEVPHPGRVVGRVRFVGPRPRLAAHDVDHQTQACGTSQASPVLTIGPGGGLADVVVSVEDIHAGRAIPARAAPPVVDQVHCRYVPHVLAVALGDSVIFRNGDAVLHNVHAEWEEGGLWFNVGQPRSGDAEARVADRVGTAKLLCDAGHPWMLAWVHVFPHPYFAVTGDDGAFEIVGLPPGEHRVRFWHEGWAVVGMASARPAYAEAVVLRQTVAVPADGEVTLEVTLPEGVATTPAQPSANPTPQPTTD